MRFALFAVVWITVLLAFGWFLVRNMIRPPRAAWLWEPAPYFSREGFEAYRKTAEKWRIRTVFAQIHLAEDATLSGTTELRRFIENSSRAGIRVFALAGAPDWIAPERLDETTGLITAIDAFNRTAPNAAGRLAGLQLDVEPYLLPQWAVDPDAVRERWLRYVDTATSHSHRHRLEIGFAIPFWIDRYVEHNGVKAPFYQHIMSVSDHVAVMSYRTRAGGENGILALSRPMRDYARVRPGVARVYIGVEMTPLPSTAVRFLTASSPPRQIEKLGLDWGDRQIRLVHAGPVYMLGLTGTRTRPYNYATSTALLELAVRARFETTAEEDVVAAAVRELPRTEGFAGANPVPAQLGTAFGQPLVAVDAIETPPGEITFSGKGASQIGRVLRQVELSTGNQQGVIGIVVHDMKALEQLPAM